jgi:hypothetical protein
MGRTVMQMLREPILQKAETASVANLSDVIFAYSTASLPATTEGRVFFNKMEKVLLEKITVKDFFNTLNSTRI